MKIHVVQFGGRAYDESVGKTVKNLPLYLKDYQHHVYDDLWLTKQEFYKINSWLYEHPVKIGFGWYAFKSFVILDAYKKAKDGDIIFYWDADSHPIADLSPLIDICEKENHMVFEENGCNNRQWCKEDAYWCMGLQHLPRDSKHFTARWMLFKKNGWENEQFLTEWLTYNVNRNIPTRDPIFIKQEHEKFNENRGDQTIFSLLCQNYGWYGYRACDAAGDSSSAEKDKYGTLFVQKWADGSKDDLRGSVHRNIL